MSEEAFQSRVVSRDSQHPWCDLGDEVVVLCTMDNAYYRLEGSGRTLWLLLATPQTITALVDGLSSVYEGRNEQVSRETSEFVERCRELGLLTVTDA